jgi:hypothetical protein
LIDLATVLGREHPPVFSNPTHRPRLLPALRTAWHLKWAASPARDLSVRGFCEAASHMPKIGKHLITTIYFSKLSALAKILPATAGVSRGA